MEYFITYIFTAIPPCKRKPYPPFERMSTQNQSCFESQPCPENVFCRGDLSIGKPHPPNLCPISCRGERRSTCNNESCPRKTRTETWRCPLGDLSPEAKKAIEKKLESACEWWEIYTILSSEEIGLLNPNTDRETIINHCSLVEEFNRLKSLYEKDEPCTLTDFQLKHIPLMLDCPRLAREIRKLVGNELNADLIITSEKDMLRFMKPPNKSANVVTHYENNNARDKRLYDEKKKYLETIFPPEDWQVACEVYAAYEDNEFLFEIDCSTSSDHLGPTRITKDNFFTRGHFWFIYPFQKPQNKFVPDSNWCCIGYEVGNEETGPNDGAILVNKNTGHVFYRDCYSRGSSSLLGLFWDRTRYIAQEERCFFMLADCLENFVAKCICAGASLSIPVAPR